MNSFKTRVLILGLTYKKNVADVRNSFPLEIYKLLKKKFKYIDICDPLLKEKKIIGVKILNDFDLNNYELIINLVNHKIFKSKILEIKKNKKSYLELF